MPGPPKQSNARKKAKGSRKIHQGEDIAPPLIEKVPTVPPMLRGKKQGDAEWKRVCKLLIEENILTEWDLPTIRVMCLEWQRYCDACEDIDKNGEYMETSTGYEQVRPSHTVRNKAFGHYEKLLQRVGADVVSRSRMKRVKQIQEQKNPYDEI